MRDKAKGMAKACRPHEWAKNIFVAFPLLYISELRNVEQITTPVVALAFVALAFSLAASSVYLINDTMDRDRDRAHPKKRHRAIAAGIITPVEAIAVAFALTVTSLAIAFQYGGTTLAALIAAYLLVSHFYTFVAKHLAFVDLVFVAILYGIRTLAAFVATDISEPRWVLWVGVAFFAAFVMELGKRKGEFLVHGASAVTRRALAKYSHFRLEFAFRTSLALFLTVYFVAAYELSQVFAITSIFVGWGLYHFWQEYREDASPQKVLFQCRKLRPLAGLCVLFYLPVLMF